LQSKPGKARDKPTPAFEKTLLDLAGEVGTVLPITRREGSLETVML